MREQNTKLDAAIKAKVEKTETEVKSVSERLAAAKNFLESTCELRPRELACQKACPNGRCVATSVKVRVNDNEFASRTEFVCRETVDQTRPAEGAIDLTAVAKCREATTADERRKCYCSIFGNCPDEDGDGSQVDPCADAGCNDSQVCRRGREADGTLIAKCVSVTGEVGGTLPTVSCANVRCASGTQCVESAFGRPSCVPIDACQKEDICPAGKRCEPRRRLCITTPCPQYECVDREPETNVCSKLFCSAGTVCNALRGTCVPDPNFVPCGSFAIGGCPDGTVCTREGCVKKEVQPIVCPDFCPQGCIAGTRLCKQVNVDLCANVDCADGKKCVGGLCVAIDLPCGGQCSATQRCQENEAGEAKCVDVEINRCPDTLKALCASKNSRCSEGQCVPLPCDQVQCKSTERCVLGRCAPLGLCEQKECPAGYSCSVVARVGSDGAEVKTAVCRPPPEKCGDAVCKDNERCVQRSTLTGEVTSRCVSFTNTGGFVRKRQDTTAKLLSGAEVKARVEAEFEKELPECRVVADFAARAKAQAEANAMARAEANADGMTRKRQDANTRADANAEVKVGGDLVGMFRDAPEDVQARLKKLLELRAQAEVTIEAKKAACAKEATSDTTLVSKLLLNCEVGEKDGAQLTEEQRKQLREKAQAELAAKAKIDLAAKAAALAARVRAATKEQEERAARVKAELAKKRERIEACREARAMVAGEFRDRLQEIKDKFEGAESQCGSLAEKVRKCRLEARANAEAEAKAEAEGDANADAGEGEAQAGAVTRLQARATAGIKITADCVPDEDDRKAIVQCAADLKKRRDDAVAKLRAELGDKARQCVRARRCVPRVPVRKCAWFKNFFARDEDVDVSFDRVRAAVLPKVARIARCVEARLDAVRDSDAATAVRAGSRDGRVCFSVAKKCFEELKNEENANPDQSDVDEDADKKRAAREDMDAQDELDSGLLQVVDAVEDEQVEDTNESDEGVPLEGDSEFSDVEFDEDDDDDGMVTVTSDAATEPPTGESLDENSVDSDSEGDASVRDDAASASTALLSLAALVAAVAVRA